MKSEESGLHGAADSRDTSSRTGRPGGPRRRLSVGGPEDLLASVPVVLGFVPTESVVMLVLRGAPGPHARVDLADGPHLQEMARALVAPALSHGVQRVALVVYAPLERGDRAAQVLSQEFAASGIGVDALVIADGHRWRSAAPGRRSLQAQEYDPWSHRFVAEAVVDGHVVLGSRDEIAAGLRVDPQRCERVEALLAQAGPPWSPAQVGCLLATAVEAGGVLDDAEVAGLRRAVETPEVRDAAWSWVPRERAREHADLWRHVLTSCAAGQGAVPAAVLAFHAWLAGDGALAWCALARAGERGGHTSLAALVEDLLTRAVVPAAWSPLTDVANLSAEACGSDAESAAGPVEGGEPAQVVDLASRRRSGAGQRSSGSLRS